MYYSGFPKIIVSLLILLSLCACASRPHNNVLVFATDTKVALDISSEPTQGNFPEVTIGYKRREGVYMPLARNTYQCSDNKSSEKKNCTTQSTKDKYRGKSGDGKIDTYSVFASVGADFSAGSESSGGLAQFFITGVAAQNFAKNKNAQKALSVRPVDQEVAEKQIDLLQKQLEKTLDKKTRDTIIEDEKSNQEKISQEVNKIIKCAQPDSDKGKAKALLDEAISKADDNLRGAVESMKDQDEKEWAFQLQGQQRLRSLLLKATNKNCPGG